MVLDLAFLPHDRPLLDVEVGVAPVEEAPGRDDCCCAVVRPSAVFLRITVPTLPNPLPKPPSSCPDERLREGDETAGERGTKVTDGRESTRPNSLSAGDGPGETIGLFFSLRGETAVLDEVPDMVGLIVAVDCSDGVIEVVDCECL